MSEEFDKQTIERASENMRSKSSFDILIQAYILMGVLMFVGGISFFFYSRFEIFFTEDEKIALAFACGGLVFSIFSFFVMKARQRRIEVMDDRLETAAAVGKFIEAWTKFEDAAKTSAFSASDTKNYTLRETFRALSKENKIGPLESIRADHLLQVRNQLVHGRKIYSRDQILKYTDDLISLLTKLI